MPLTKSSSADAFKSNLKAEMAAGKPQKQALAIAYSVKRRAKKHGGGIPKLAAGGVPWFARSEARQMSSMHTGPIGGTTLGRHDVHNISVPSGSYVLPSDHIAALGQGNSHAGMAVVNHMFGGPYGSSGGPYGSSLPKGGHGGSFMPKPPKLGKFADGGKTKDIGSPVPIIAASGEVVLTPEQVAKFGDGDVDRGHLALDRWVENTRKKHIKTLKSLPKPAKD